MKSAITLSSLLILAGTAGAQCESKSATACESSTQGQAMQASYTAEPELNLVETAVEAGSFETLVAAVKAAGLAETLSGETEFTVFAPTDEAFSKLPEGTVEMLLKPENKGTLRTILLYHVVKGNVMAKDVVELDTADTVSGQRVNVTVRGDHVRVDDANVIKTDIAATNGTIHVIDRVIMPSTKDIVATAMENGSFGTLVEAVKAAGLVEALKSKGPITVFAPTDEAFANLPEGTLESLLKPENKDRLTEILTYHVVKGRVYSDQALKAGSAETLQGSKVHITTKGGTAMVNDAELVSTDLDASNGVIHVIDSVLIPSD